MPTDIKELARLGAQTRIAELTAEIEELRRAFPGVNTTTPRKRGRPATATKTTELSPDKPKSKRGQQNWSAAARKAVSARMKKYWAARKKAAKR